MLKKKSNVFLVFINLEYTITILTTNLIKQYQTQLIFLKCQLNSSHTGWGSRDGGGGGISEMWKV